MRSSCELTRFCAAASLTAVSLGPNNTTLVACMGNLAARIFLPKESRAEYAAL